MASLPVYSSQDFQLFWSSVHLGGLAPDPFLVAMRNEDLTDEEVGADNQLSTSKTANRTGMFTVTFQQMSLSNKILADVVRRQEESSGLIKADLMIKDASGSVISNHRSCYIKTTPEQSFGSSATGSSRAWGFFVERFDFAGLTETDGANPLVLARDAAVSAASASIIATGRDALSGALDNLF